jgi:hypothetical protein
LVLHNKSRDTANLVRAWSQAPPAPGLGTIPDRTLVDFGLLTGVTLGALRRPLGVLYGL